MISIKKIFYFLIWMLLFQQMAVAQTKRELPTNFFNGFSYKLPGNFDYNDSLQLDNEIIKLSAEVLKWDSDALINYTIRDSTALYNLLVRSSLLNLLLSQHQKCIDEILAARKLMPTPDYLLPFGLFNLAYSKACLEKKDDGSTAFGNILSSKLIEQINAINSDFRNHIVNQNKGRFTPAITVVFWKNVTRTIEQSILNAKGSLNYANANLLLTQFQQYKLRKKYRAQIENVLFAVSPAKVREQIIKIPMRDSINLNAFIYKNELTTEKLSVIVALSPYPTGTESIIGNVFATNGYIFVYVDNRGRRQSEGSFMPYEDDAREIGHQDTFERILRKQNLAGKKASEIIKIVKDSFPTQVRFMRPYICFRSKDKYNKLQVLIYQPDRLNYYMIDLRDSIVGFKKSRPLTFKVRTIAGEVTGALGTTLKRNNIDPSLTKKLSGVYAWTIDFFKMRKGDKFAISFTERYINDTIYDGIDSLRAAFFEYKGEKIYAFPFQQDRSGKVYYYNQDGKALKNYFLKAPLKFVNITSRFSKNRFHPWAIALESSQCYR